MNYQVTYTLEHEQHKFLHKTKSRHHRNRPMTDPTTLVAAAIILTTSLCAAAGAGVPVVLTRVRP